MENKDLNALLLTLYELAISFSTNGKHDLGLKLFESVLTETDDAALKARCYLRLGQLCEQRRQYSSALDYYDLGLALPQSEHFTTYFLNNNAAYCLNLLGRHQDAEALCRKAIETDASKHNAWKNLGISLEPQGDFLGAAWAYLEAAKMQPKDTRAYVLLDRLLAEHSELSSRFSAMLSERAACLEAIKADLSQSQSSGVISHVISRLKYVPGKGYLEEKDGIETLTSNDAIMQVYTVTTLKMLDDHPNVWIEVCADADALNDQSKYPKKSSTEVSGTIQPVVIMGKKQTDRTK